MKVTLCDCCEEEYAKTISLCVGSEMGPAGSSDPEYETVDLCLDCLVKRLSVLKHDVNLNKTIMNILKGSKK